MTFYGYNTCATCRKAKSFLTARSIPFEEVDITATPPPRALLQSILRSGRYRLKDLFNRSGQAYRDLRLSERFDTLSEARLLDLLAGNGKLVKRPIITDGRKATVGFIETELSRTWASRAHR